MDVDELMSIADRFYCYKTASAAWKAKATQLRKRVAELEKWIVQELDRRAELEEVCKVIEWVEMGTIEDGTPYIVCPYCQYENEHKDNCRLKAALNKSK